MNQKQFNNCARLFDNMMPPEGGMDYGDEMLLHCEPCGKYVDARFYVDCNEHSGSEE